MIEIILCILITLSELTIAIVTGLALVVFLQYISIKVFKVNLYKKIVKFFINLEKIVELI